MAGALDAANASLFLAERYTPRASEAAARADGMRAHAACAALAREGVVVRYLGAVLVPLDETCFAFFEARSAADVRRLAERAGVSFQRVVQATRLQHTPTFPLEAG